MCELEKRTFAHAGDKDIGALTLIKKTSHDGKTVRKVHIPTQKLQ